MIKGSGSAGSGAFVKPPMNLTGTGSRGVHLQNGDKEPTVYDKPKTTFYHLTDEVRAQLGLAKELPTTEYDRLVLSLQSPLPNEQDMAISVCTLLSNDTKHALKFSKSPAVMELLLAHAGIFNHCNTRILMEETYERARGLSFADFWKSTVSNSDVRELLCECSLERYQNGIGIVPPGLEDDGYEVDMEKADEDVSMEEEDSNTVLNQSIQTNSSSLSEEESAESLSQTTDSGSVPLDVVDGMSMNTSSLNESNPNQDTGTVAGKVFESPSETGGPIPAPNPQEPKSLHHNEGTGEIELTLPPNSSRLHFDESDEEFTDELEPPGVEKEVIWDLLDKDVTASNVDCEPCCPRCPCLRQPTIFENEMVVEEGEVVSDKDQFNLTEKMGQRIHQVASIIRNLSFDKLNAEIMGHNSCMLRFILVTANCSYGSLSQLSFDTLGNIARYMNLEDPLENPYFGMVISLVIDGIFSTDRFRVLRSLETLREWCREESNEVVLSRIMDSKFFSRLFELLTLTDIMLLIYTLECILSITSTGVESMCNELVHVQGSVDTLVSLVSVEAQSYGPKGCIHMRVVETLVGHPSLAVSQSQPQPPAATARPTTVPSTPGSSALPALISTASSQPIFSQKIQEPRGPTPFSSVSQPVTPSPTPSTLQPTSLQPIQLPVLATPTDTRLQRLSWKNAPQLVFRPTMVRLTVTKSQNGVHSLSISNASPGIPTGNVLVPQTIAPSSNSTVSPGISTSTVLVPQTPTPTPPISQQETHVFSPSINIVTSGKVNEDTWAVVWMKAAFEQVQGCSIEQGKMYRMYCAARKESTVLSMEEFINCVKCTYGTGIGPVIKNFSGTPLSFLEGLRPKMTLTNVGLGVIGQPNIVKIAPQEASTNNRTEITEQKPCLTSSTEPDIPPRELKTTTSPILKATLSRPTKVPKNSTSKKQKGIKGKKSRRGSEESRSSVINPTSSVIRSLLASKVTQRQQKRLQQTEFKKSGVKNYKVKKKIPEKKDIKVNGVDSIMKTEPSEASSPSSSLQSSESVESVNPSPLISFQGVLQRNGLSSDSGTKSVDGNVNEEQHGTKFKGMLVDLLERKVVPRETVNGLVGSREIRISDRGLELVDAIEADSSSNSNAPILPPTSNHKSPPEVHSATTFSGALSGVKKETNTSSANSQQMTFYSASDPPVTVVEGVTKNCRTENRPYQNCFSSSEHDVLTSGGGGGGHSSSNEDQRKETVDVSMDDADLLEKFNEFSDLIVVPPEQLGLKRSRSAFEESSAAEIPYLCEWLGCGRRFPKHEQLLMHALQTHTPESLVEAVRCEWHTSGCDGLVRKRFSLMTHLQDRHCSKAALELALYRRKNRIEPPPPPQPPVNHLGYAPNAAFHAIKRHALQFTNPKELTDDNEGPVTKSIRLTSALILKNLCNYSQIGRRSLRRHESHLVSIAMSNVESARTISQLLYDMNELGS